MSCSFCGTTVQAGHAFCTRCGRRSLAQIPVATPLVQQKHIENYPGFTTFVAIVNLVFSLLRVPLVGFSIFGYANMRMDNPLAQSVVAEIFTGSGVAVFLFIASLLLLLKVRAAVPFAWVAVVAVFSNIGVAVWQSFLIAEGFKSPEERIGAVVGSGVVIVVRLVLLGLFMMAIVLAQGYFRSKSRSPSVGQGFHP
jgi:hypothetical protein